MSPSSQEMTRPPQSAEAAPPPPADPLEALTARALEEMAAAWRQGQRLPAEELLARHPDLAASAEAAVRLVYEEVCLREEAGEPDAAAAVVGRFPQWRAELEVLLDCHRLLRASEPAGPAFPDVGQTLGELRLLRELGRGAKGRVYLCAERFLADRPVVLKLAPRDGQEHLALARLQHTHIMPLYGVHDFPDRHLRALCMPYVGGQTLGRILELLRGQPPGERGGMQLVQALDQAQAAPVELPGPAPARRLLAQSDYAEAVCWIGACLAEALQHAHERGIIHLDIKPSNVLLAADGTPMLLDFHLARPPLRKGEPVPDWFGGTRAYMAPEQLRTLEAVRRREPVPEAVDGRADVYALGLLLYEALSGGRLPGSEPRGLSPRSSDEPPPLHRLNPQVSVGLSDIVRKCLAPAPQDRYDTAAALALDLRRHLEHLALRGVPNRSLGERWRKWRRRKPHALVVYGLLLLFVAAATLAGVLGWGYYGQRLGTAQADLDEGRRLAGRQQYPEAITVLRRGLETAAATPGAGPLARDLEAAVHRAEREQAAHDLHRVAEGVRFLYDGEALPPDAARLLEARCRELWEARDLIRATARADLDPAREEQVAQDLLDLALFRAELAVRQAKAAGDADAGRQALRGLAEAEAAFGPSPALARARQTCAEAVGDAAAAREAARAAESLAPRTAWDHYTLGRFLLRRGDLKAAAAELGQAVQLEPGAFWPYFHWGTCLYRLGRYGEAATAFTACVALSPGTAACYYNRGLAETGGGDVEAALRDYGAALERDPRLAAAALNRAVLLIRRKRYPEALDELRRALDTGADPAAVHYNRALAYEGQHDRAAALAELDRALQNNRGHREARDLLDRLRRVP